MFRRLMIILLSTVAVGALLLWIASHVGRSASWSWRSKPLTLRVWSRVDHSILTARFYGFEYTMSARAEEGILRLAHARIREYDPSHLTPGSRTRYWGSFEFAERFNVFSVTNPKQMPRWVVDATLRRGKPIIFQQSQLAMPLWIVIVTFGAYPCVSLAWRLATRRRRRRQLGLCVNCGYNLTGNETGVCPECGHESESREKKACSAA